MTEKEEKTLLLASFCMLLIAGLTVATGLYFIKPVSGEASEQPAVSDAGEDKFSQEAEQAEEPEKPEEPYQELYYLEKQGFAAGTVTEANEKHAECFVILACESAFEKTENKEIAGESAENEETRSEEAKGGAESITGAGNEQKIADVGVTIRIYYNDDFIIPGFDSRVLALELHRLLTDKQKDADVNVVFSEDDILRDAMVPAVRIETDAAASDIKPVLSECITNIFTETKEKP